MTAAATEIPMPFVFTDNACNKVKDLIAEVGNPELKLRVFVTGGGCSGFQYGFSLDDGYGCDDRLFTAGDVTLVVDETSLGLLAGAELDYVDELVGARLPPDKPQARGGRRRGATAGG